jgi:hypothetical protein
MKTVLRLQGVLAIVFFYLQLQVVTNAQVNVTTYHNDNARTGQNTQETVLTTANTNSLTFGKLFSVGVDGQVYAQPLVLSNVSIGGGTHNVTYVATEHDSVYAIDANDGTVYWQKSLILNGGTPIPTGAFGFNNNIDPQYGITGTPVIDTTRNTIYVVASTEEYGLPVHRVHALDVTTGAEKIGSPVVVGGSFAGLQFDPELEFNRPGLLLVSGHVVVAFGKHTDTSDYGWVFSYNPSTLAEEAAYSTDLGSTFGGIWMGGDGIAADPSGYLFFSTANGQFDGSVDYGNSIIKLGLPFGGAFTFLDYFTPHDQQYLNDHDLDLGSGGVLVLPDLTSGSHPRLLVQSGKEGTIYLINRDTAKMGEYCGNSSCTDKTVQELAPQGSNIVGVWGSPAYWNGYVYFGSATKDDPTRGNISDYMKAYSFNAGGSGLLSTTPTSHTPEQFAWPAPNPSVSSNGTSNGILWALDNGDVLHAYKATDLSKELYSNIYGSSIKFSVPTIANGHVYVGTLNSLVVYGLPPARSWSWNQTAWAPPCSYPGGEIQVILSGGGELSWSFGVYSPDGSNYSTTWNITNSNGVILGSGSFIGNSGTGTTSQAPIGTSGFPPYFNVNGSFHSTSQNCTAYYNVHVPMH